jgi:SnoaL-like polyketide cyclase
VTEANKEVVRRLVAEVLNGGHLEVVDELYAPELAPAARRWIAPFRASFPDVHMEIVELIAEGDKVVGRFTCSATTWEHGSAKPPWGVGSSGSMRSGSSGSARAGSWTSGRWRTPSTGCANSGSPRSRADPDDGRSGAGVPGALATGHVVGNQELGRPTPLVVDEQCD